MDKLSVEEAGFRNCVTVPSGAPQIVSAKDLPPSEKDRAFQYLWNCKEYLENVSQIILATDGDASSRQALAEEPARRLGRERCWIVRWPKNENSNYFKDANEVLRFLGPAALREVIETAQVITFVRRHVGTYTPLLAGNSVYVDFQFIKKHMPDLASLFSHVVVDVSSVKALCIRWFPRDQKKAPSKENKHRAMDDIRESIMELKYYKENIFKTKTRK